MNGVKYIVKKELTRVFTDKKLVFSLFILPVIIMVGLYSLIGRLQSAMIDDIEKHVPSVYIQNMPEGFKDVMTAAGFNGNIANLEMNADVTEIKNGILKGTTDLLVVFETDFLNKISNYESEGGIPEVKTYYNSSEQYSSAVRNSFVAEVLSVYQQQLLAERFGDLNQLTVFNIDVDPESSIIVDEDKAAGKLIGTMLPYFITLMLFAGAMSLGVDAITGEKERGTIASMLLTPLNRRDIVLGKLLSLSLLSVLSAAVYAVSMIVSMPNILKQLTDGNLNNLSMKFSAEQIIQLFVVMITLVYLYVALVSLVAVLSKTAKEANTYISPMYIAVIVAGMITMFTGSGEIPIERFAIPVYGSALSIQQILAGELTMVQFGAAIGGTLALSVILTFFITKAFNSEKVMFNA
ncbi:MAG: ABC transporter permease subunit [Anaerocolumna aminovalerica]|jgi:sodium transport system permease protein|uniref:ABC transporter permease n=1 Tax=Anaerocolumna aminovalerica TaxID=1527 RepID=UPI00280BBC1B|nr:ABC transporter permease [Anaerocolumna aminovalerica]MDU6263532.1 ABC transporter permease subunit [Anaerocolumna aminovalerica]